MTHKATLKLGTISHGTLRPEDVVPALLWVLEHRTDKRGAIKARKLLREFEKLPENDPDGADMELWQKASDALEAYAPPYCYVGAIEEDGSDIGVWLSEDALQNGIADGEVWQEQECNCRRGASLALLAWNDPRRKGQHAGFCASKMPKSATYRLVISDHGNQSLYSRSGRCIW